MRARVAFVGAGNMASAMVMGLMGGNKISPDELVCYTGSRRTAAALAASTGIRCASTVDALLYGADTVVIAFKPQHLAGADPKLGELTAGKLVISVLAGKRLHRLLRTFSSARNIVRAMPNTPGQI